MKKSAKKFDSGVKLAPEPPINMAANALAPSPDMCVGQEMARPRPSKTERRARLIAAHVALEAVRYELDDYMHQNEVRKEIAAAIGRMELAD